MSDHQNCSAGNEDELCILRADRSMLGQAMVKACDLLSERIYGNPARSPGHNARIVLERALAATMPGADRNIPDVAQPTLDIDLIEVVAMGICAKTAIKNGGSGHGCWWELGTEAKDGFRDIAKSLLAAQPPAAPVEPTDCKHRIAVTPRNGAPHGAGFACGLTGGHCIAKAGCGYEPHARSSVDVVERLRPIANYIGLYKPHCQTILEAADEIERLRNALQPTAQWRGDR